MIEFISEAEYEKRFNVWQRRRQVSECTLIAYVQSSIELASKGLAIDVVTQPKKAPRMMTRLVKEARFQALRAEFQKTFVAAPTGMDRNAIAFSGDWKAKPVLQPQA